MLRLEPLAVLPGHDHNMLNMVILRASRNITIRQVHTLLCFIGLNFILDLVMNFLQVAVFDAVLQFQKILWRDLLARGVVARIEVCFCDALDIFGISKCLACGNLVCTHAPVLLINRLPRLVWPIIIHDLELDDSVELGAMQIMLLSVRCIIKVFGGRADLRI